MLYWYKSTNTGAAEQLRASLSVTATPIYYSLYLLYWYKSTNTDAARRITDFSTANPTSAYDVSSFGKVSIANKVLVYAALSY